MIEKCPFCNDLFIVSSVGGIVDLVESLLNVLIVKKQYEKNEEIGYFIEKLVKALGITDEVWDEMGAELNTNT